MTNNNTELFVMGTITNVVLNNNTLNNMGNNLKFEGVYDLLDELYNDEIHEEIQLELLAWFEIGCEDYEDDKEYEEALKHHHKLIPLTIDDITYMALTFLYNGLCLSIYGDGNKEVRDYFDFCHVLVDEED